MSLVGEKRVLTGSNSLRPCLRRWLKESLRVTGLLMSKKRIRWLFCNGIFGHMFSLILSNLVNVLAGYSYVWNTEGKAYHRKE